MQDAINYIKHFLPTISDKGIKKVFNNTEIQWFNKGDIIINKGEVPRYFYILRTGIARSYILGKNKKEHIKTLHLPPSAVGPLSALIQRRKTQTIYDCITDCEVVQLDYYKFMKEVSKDLELSELNRRVMETIFIKRDNRVDDLTVLDATERYLKLKKRMPNIENLVAQYHIASYLNISPVQLSRIRKKLYSQ